MQAVVLANGFGDRRSPLISQISKPMLGLFDRPIIEHVIDLLRLHDIRDIVIAAGRNAESIVDHFGSGARWGVNIEYSLEEAHLGTAGSLRRAQPLIRDTFMVIPGNAVCDLDLTSALEFHKRRSGIATALAQGVEDSSEHCMIGYAASGSVEYLRQKPGSSEIAVRTTYAGVSIFEPEIISYVPYGAYCDLVSDVFPLLIQNQEPFFACRPEGHCRQVNAPSDYRGAHTDALAGRVQLDLRASRFANEVWIGDGADIHPTAKLVGPLYIGKGVKLRRGSFVGRFSVIGENSIVDEGASLVDSIACCGSYVGSYGEVFRSILGPGFELVQGQKVTNEIALRGGIRSGFQAGNYSDTAVPRDSRDRMMTWSGLQAARLIEDAYALR